MPAKPRDLTGQRFGLLVAREYLVKEFEKQPLRRGYWKCDCDCGVSGEYPASNLILGRTKSCGCQKGGGTIEKPGSTYGMLTILKQADSLIWFGKKRRAWLCKCECGKEIVVSGKHLRSGHTQSCGCRVKEAVRQAQLLEIAGERHGRLVALRRIPTEEQKLDRNGYPRGDWEWKCDCGNIHIASIGAVRWGSIKSCGCLAREQSVLNFHNDGHRAYAEDPQYAERNCLIYLIEVGNQLDKIGITFDLENRFYKGQVTDIWWTKEMSRAKCWAVEQAALKATMDYRVSNPPQDIARGGTTEFRSGLDLEETIEMLEEMCEEVKQLGWRSFYDKFVLD